MNTANPSDTPRVCEICFKQYVPVGWAQRRCKECGTKYDHEHRRVREQKRNATGKRGKRTYPSNAVWRLTYRLKCFGLLFEQYQVWKLAGCAICGNAFIGENLPYIDHDHRHCAGIYGCAKCVRGLLCNRCNRQFISAVDLNPSLRKVVTQKVLDYIDSKQ